MKGNHLYSELIRKIQKVLLQVGQKKCPGSGLIAQQGPKERLQNNMLFRILNEKKQLWFMEKYKFNNWYPGLCYWAASNYPSAFRPSPVFQT